jgi:hypothetical protein
MIPERFKRTGASWSRPVLGALVAAGLSLSIVASPAASGAATLRHTSGEHSTTTTNGAVLKAGDSLDAGMSLVSHNGLYRLIMQSDGNLVLYWKAHPLWQTKTRGHAAVSVIMQADGNLVLYDTFGPLWDSRSTQPARGDYTLALQNDGDMIIYSASGHPIWQSYTDIPPGLKYGDSGLGVLRLQLRLRASGYWVGSPNGVFGDSTQQAVWALQKAAELPRSGVATATTVAALVDGVVPTPRQAWGNLIEVDLHDDLLMVIQHGKLAYILNVSTGGGYTYTDKGVTSVAITPRGVFHIFSVINGLDVDSLGALWRPRFFTSGGIALHGDSYVPPYPVSHGCVRMSDEAINWIWAANIAPIGEEVWVY